MSETTKIREESLRRAQEAHHHTHGDGRRHRHRENEPVHKNLLFALAGNQNCGKTTLFNAFTGSNQHVGNFPGVTVERKDGTIKGHREAVVVDLPGIYSLSPYTSEEIVTRDFLIKDRPDAIINIVDATNLERNLYLSLQLMELSIPMVIALNMMDEVRASGNSIDVGKLSELLGIPVIPISASKNEGIDELTQIALRIARRAEPPRKMDFCTGEVHKAIHSIAHVIEEQASEYGYPQRFAATKLVEGDEPTMEALHVTANQKDILGHIIDDMEHALQTDREAALADMRYNFIEKLCAQCVVKRHETHEQVRSEKIDRILTHKYFGIPIFFAIMLLVFWLTFGVVGSFLSDLFESGVNLAVDGLSSLLITAGVSEWMHSLIIDGICAGVGSVLSFLPVIVLLFFFLSLLEDSGYMARVAFVMDKLLRKIGLSGRSFVPMLIGFGCRLPANMSTRTLSSERDRKMTIVLTPFMSCSAKLPIYGMFTMAFFPNHAGIVMISVYIIGIIVAILSGLLLKNTVFRGNPIPFVMELPAYRIPSAKSVVLHMWEKAKDFIRKAFTIIFLASMVIWFLQSFDWSFNLVADNTTSMLASIGKLIAPIFVPLGFADWRASTALLTGITAKETVVSTFTVLTGAATNAELTTMLHTVFTPLTAFSFLVFTVLYMPCVAAFAASRRELGSMRSALATALYQTSAAYLAALMIFQIGRLFVGV